MGEATPEVAELWPLVDRINRAVRSLEQKLKDNAPVEFSHKSYTLARHNGNWRILVAIDDVLRPVGDAPWTAKVTFANECQEFYSKYLEHHTARVAEQMSNTRAAVEVLERIAGVAHDET